jgi:hypothetical protein
MLETFTLPDTVVEGASNPCQHPPKSWSNNNNISMVDSCCVYTCVGNPFPRCTDGNCTWWVYYKYCGSGGVPFRGDASEWWDEVLDHLTEWERGTTPKPNIANICWWGSNHVAFAANYTNGSGTINISEMGCGSSWDCARNRNISINDPDGYIRRCTICPT